jgi:SAM-dependent methyltransferase/uncharacterized protein YbaR (Trm112 family)
MDEWLERHLVCPRDKSHLQLTGGKLICQQGHSFPYIDGIPVLLLQDVSPTQPAHLQEFSEGGSHDASRVVDGTTGEDRVHPHVQRWVGATCGNLYKPLIDRLTDYPVPEFPLPNGNGERLLDIGCNWGRWCAGAAKKGYTPVGVDPSFHAIRAARDVARQLGVSAQFVVGDGRRLPFATGCFDVVFSYSVLQHFSKEDARTCLAEAGRVLRAGGRSLIQMANHLGLRNLLFQWRRGFREPTDFEVRYWTVPELRAAFEGAIGPSTLSVDGFFALGAQRSDLRLLPLRSRTVVRCSEALRGLSGRVPWLQYLADSLYVESRMAGE